MKYMYLGQPMGPLNRRKMEEQATEEEEPPRKRFKDLVAVIARVELVLIQKMKRNCQDTKQSCRRSMKPRTQWTFGSQLITSTLLSAQLLMHLLPPVFSTSGESCMEKHNQMSGKTLNGKCSYRTSSF